MVLREWKHQDLTLLISWNQAEQRTNWVMKTSWAVMKTVCCFVPRSCYLRSTSLHIQLPASCVACNFAYPISLDDHWPQLPGTFIVRELLPLLVIRLLVFEFYAAIIAHHVNNDCQKHSCRHRDGSGRSSSHQTLEPPACSCWHRNR